MKVIDDEPKLNLCGKKGYPTKRKTLARSIQKLSGNSGDYAVPVNGHSLPLSFNPGPVECGDISDGVEFHFGRGSDYQGAWVISYADLVELARIASEQRSSSVRDSTPRGSTDAANGCIDTTK